MGHYTSKSGCSLTPDHLGTCLERHENTHFRAENLLKHVKKVVIGKGMTDTVPSIANKCEICCENNPNTRKGVVLGVSKAGVLPGYYWQTDFVELLHKEGYWYILVLVDTFNGWPEACLCGTNTAKDVVKVLLSHIIPRFRVPLRMSSDRGPRFVATVVEEVSQILGITWHLHTPYRPQASGKVERMNRILKTQISKIYQETSMTWIEALPIDLPRIGIQLGQRDNISPYEILYGRPYQIPHIQGEIHMKGKFDLQRCLMALGSTLQKLQNHMELSRPIGLDIPAHPFQPGNWVYMKW
ncbi:putative protein YagA-like protein [Turdus rufiventris]|nr:putative protein YagA-like protein [Turdus rufiventris]